MFHVKHPERPAATNSETTRPGAGPGAGTFPGTGTGTGTDFPLFDPEKLEVYRVAREFLVVATALAGRKVPRDLRDRFDRASSSILFNIAEGAGRTTKADEQRSSEIARGSATRAATQLEVLRIRVLLAAERYQ
jgi:four helix bundle protein